MSSKKTMINVVHGVHNAIMSKDTDALCSFFIEEAVIQAPGLYFKNIIGIKKWMKWLNYHFKEITFKDLNLIIERNTVSHEYVINVTTHKGKTGIENGTAIYVFQGDKIQWLTLYYDRLALAQQTTNGLMATKAVNSIVKEFEKGIQL